MYNKNIDYLHSVRIGSNPEPWGAIRNQSVDYGFLILQSRTEPWIQKTNPNIPDLTGPDRITDFTDSLLNPSQAFVQAPHLIMLLVDKMVGTNLVH